MTQEVFPEIQAATQALDDAGWKRVTRRKRPIN
jgi:hypothetical protein